MPHPLILPCLLAPSYPGSRCSPSAARTAGSPPSHTSVCGRLSAAHACAPAVCYPESLLTLTHYIQPYPLHPASPTLPSLTHYTQPYPLYSASPTLLRLTHYTQPHLLHPASPTTPSLTHFTQHHPLHPASPTTPSLTHFTQPHPLYPASLNIKS